MSGLEQRLLRLLADVTVTIEHLERELAEACAAEADAERRLQQAKAAVDQAIQEAEKSDSEHNMRMAKIAGNLDDLEKEVSRIRKGGP